MKVTILGNNSALPAFGRHPTAQVVAVNNELLLLDCGEGTQIQMQRYGLKWRHLHNIFISHLHGDHYFGLPGLINSMSLLGRTAPLTLYGPAGLMPILQSILDVADTVLSYPLTFRPLPEGAEVLLDNEWMRVSCFPVEHKIPTHGFLITQKNNKLHLLPEKCREYEIPQAYYSYLKQGQDYERKDGFIVRNEWVTEKGPGNIKYAYCADTRFTESFLPHIMDSHTIYHEATYLESDHLKAAERFHSTATQAAKIATAAGAKQLLLGHFSSKYKELDLFTQEAGAVFSNVIVTQEGTTYEV